jgi:hypothetical protein
VKKVLLAALALLAFGLGAPSATAGSSDVAVEGQVEAVEVFPDGSGRIFVWGHAFFYDANTVFKTDSGKTAEGIAPGDFVELTILVGSDSLTKVVEKKPSASG